ncbi:MAG: aldehyde dehydrogenase family protein, partial [Alphaproteobacteria bacterium]|nr:aldehyde dehydrogenase family protein [Alphaproteobacteria bacterium]
AAAEHLTPCTLELGGKSPAILDRSFDLPTAARRIIYGKFLNNGQTCIAPDYMLIPKELILPFVDAFKQCLEELYGDLEKLAESEQYGRIINERHFQRLVGYLNKNGLNLVSV